MSNGIPFFIQLIADFSFKRLNGRSTIDTTIINELMLNDQEDLYPLIMKIIDPNERKVIEAIALEKGYTVDILNITKRIDSNISDVRITISRLLNKNIIEELETNRFRFLHDRFKSYIQREWLITRQSNHEKLQNEVETIMQLIASSPDDPIMENFNYPQTAITCFKAILLNDPPLLERLLRCVIRIANRKYADLFVNIFSTLYVINRILLARDLTKNLDPYIEKNQFYDIAASIYALPVELKLVDIDIEIIRYAIKLIKESHNKEESRQKTKYFRKRFYNQFTIKINLVPVD